MRWREGEGERERERGRERQREREMEGGREEERERPLRVHRTVGPPVVLHIQRVSAPLPKKKNLNEQIKSGIVLVVQPSISIRLGVEVQ